MNALFWISMLPLSLLIANIAVIGRVQTGKTSRDAGGEVRKVFDMWSTALTGGDKKSFRKRFGIRLGW